MMLQKLCVWIKKGKAAEATLIIVGLAVLLIAALLTGTVLGFIGKYKLDRANTALWVTRQENHQLRTVAQEEAERYENTIDGLRAELAAFKDAAATAKEMAGAEALTPEMVYKFSDTNGLTITILSDGNGNGPRVRPSPRAGTVSYGRIRPHTVLSLEYFYTTSLPQNGELGAWLGIPLELLSDEQLSWWFQLNRDWDITADADGIIWVSWGYLKASDYMRNYSSEKVELAYDRAGQRADIAGP